MEGMRRALTALAPRLSRVGPLDATLRCFVSWLNRDRGGCVSFVSWSPGSASAHLHE